MGGREYSEEEKQQAIDLALELKRKMERYYPEAPDADRIAEMQAIRDTLEQMGFVVETKVSLDVETLSCTADVTLWLPKVIH